MASAGRSYRYGAGLNRLNLKAFHAPRAPSTSATGNQFLLIIGARAHGVRPQ